MNADVNLVLSLIGLGIAGLALAQTLGRLGLARFGSARIDLWALVLLFAAFLADFLDNLVLKAAAAGHPSAWGGFYLLLYPAFVLAPWAYVRALTETNRQRLNRGLWQLAFLWLSAVVLVVPMLCLPAKERAGLLAAALPETPSAMQAVALLGMSLFLLGWLCALGIAAVSTIRRLHQHRRRVRQLLSAPQTADLRWFSILLYFLILAYGLILSDQLASMALGDELLGEATFTLVELAILCGFALVGLQQQPPLPSWIGEAEEPDEPGVVGTSPKPAIGNDPSGATRACGPAYARSGLSSEDCDRILERLNDLMRAEQLWQNPFLTLKDLADRAGVKPYYVSQAINTRSDCNFYDYVNRWRVAAACRALRESDATVLAIAEQSGFNSKSTFNAVFRKETGQTPSQFRKANETIVVAGTPVSSIG